MRLDNIAFTKLGKAQRKWIFAEQDLLEQWLNCSPEERKVSFADTATAARVVGSSQRTIQAWIDAGLIQSVPVGKKHQVLLVSLRGYLKSCVDLWEAR